jgi:hypothetical protein
MVFAGASGEKCGYWNCFGEGISPEQSEFYLKQVNKILYLI